MPGRTNELATSPLSRLGRFYVPKLLHDFLKPLRYLGIRS